MKVVEGWLFWVLRILYFTEMSIDLYTSVRNYRVGGNSFECPSSIAKRSTDREPRSLGCKGALIDDSIDAGIERDSLSG